MTASTTTPSANADNRRIGQNHRRWFGRMEGTPGSTPNFLSTQATLLEGAAPRISHKTMAGGGSSCQLSRAWADKSILAAALEIETELSDSPKFAAERSFLLASRVMGLGRSSERVGKSATSADARVAGSAAERFVACMEFDADRDAQKIFVRMAMRALAGSADATHLGLHAGYGRANGYRGTHMLVKLSDLAACSLRAESRFEARGSTIRVVAIVDGEAHPLVSFKRKGGDGPSERYSDQMQAALLSRGARAAGAKLAGTVSRRDTGRSVVDIFTAPVLSDLDSTIV